MTRETIDEILKEIGLERIHEDEIPVSHVNLQEA